MPKSLVFRHVIRAFVCLLLLSAFSSPDACAEEEKKSDIAADKATIVARVGDEIITGEQYNQDLLYRWQQLSMQSQQKIPLDKRFRKQVLDELINGLLIRLMAEASKIDVPAEEVEAAWKEGRMMAGSEEAYQAYLSKNRLSEETLRRQLKQRILTQKWIEANTLELAVGEAEILEGYKQWDQDKLLDRTIKTADIAYILIQGDPDDEEASKAAKEKIEAIRERIVAGESFQEVAKEVSEDRLSARYGGMFYESAPGLVPKEVEERMFTLPLGEVSEPFQGRRGWQLIQVLSRNEPGVIPLEHVRDKIVEEILAGKRNRFLSEKVDQARLVYHIEIVHEALK